jgi:hypothetical protein
MANALYVLLVLGAFGAFDTIYYHEWRLRLPSTPSAAPELRLHASRDFAYTIVFGSLAWRSWDGLWTWLLAGILLFEIWMTLTDFLEEDRVRRLPPGERVMHALMGIAYGVFLALLYPEAARWSKSATGLGSVNYGIVSWTLTLFAAGVFLSGIRDLYASRRLSRNLV